MSASLPSADAPRPFGGAFVILRWLPAALGAAVGLGYFAAAMLGARWVVADLGVSMVWPATGVGAALLASFGLRWWPAVVVGALGESLIHGVPWQGAMPLAMIAGLHTSTVAWIIRSDRQGAAPWVDRPAGIVRVFLACTVPGTVAAAVGAVILIAVNYAGPDAQLFEVWRTWWLSDTLGILIFAPPLLAWLAPLPPTTIARRSWLEALLLTIGAFATAWFIFLGPILPGRETQPIVVLLLPFVVWAGVRFGLRGGASIALMISLIALFGVVNDGTVADTATRLRSIAVAQAFSAVLALTGCVLGGAVVTRESAELLAAGRDDQIRRLVNAVPSVLFRFTVQRNGTMQLKFLSEGTGRIFGRSADQIERDLPGSMELVLKEDRPRLVASVGTVIARREPWSATFRIRADDGAVRWIRGQSVPDPESSADAALVWNGVLTDITAEQSAEIFETEQRRVLEALATGTSREEALELIVRLVEGQLPGAVGAVWLLDANDGRMVLGATRHTPKAFIDEVNGSRAADRGSLAAVALDTGERMYIEDITRDERGSAAIPAAHDRGVRGSWLVPFFGAGGRTLGVLSVYFTTPQKPERRDLAMFDAVATLAGLVVQRFEADRARRHVEDQLEQAQRMEALGRLAGGIAHDFNNLLTVITNSAVLLETELPRDLDAAGDVAMIRHSAARAAALVRQLLAFGRRQPWQPTPVQLGEVVQRLEPVIRGVLGEQHELRTELEPGLPDILADAGQLEQVIVNLVMNARDAMEQRAGRLTLAVERLGRAGVRLRVRDTGAGMTSEVQARIFEPFFTTKPVGRGTGLGLAMVFAIVERSGGVVRVESTEGEGADFILEWEESVTVPAGTSAR